MQVVRVILARESQTKPREMWEKSIKDANLSRVKGRRRLVNFTYSLSYLTLNW